MRKMRCHYCGHSFEYYMMAFYCSPTCEKLALNSREPNATCDMCGRPFYQRKAYTAARVFCTAKCSNKFYNDRSQKRKIVQDVLDYDPYLERELDPEMVELEAFEAGLLNEPKLWEYPTEESEG